MKKNLNDWLIQQGINRKTFASSVKSSPSTVTRLLNENGVPDLELALRIEAFTGGWMTCSDWVDTQEGVISG
ncbi:hypothetical protein [Pleomorphomonas sp. PLEO]|uniref:hypothetical protein n=1 Tax=Pleomorphomonas sp. PLEO TaxID=3239306 RepID=UPI00351EF6CD